MFCILYFKGKQVVTSRFVWSVYCSGLAGCDRRVSYRGQGQGKTGWVVPFCVMVLKRSHSLYVRNVRTRKVIWLSLGKRSSLFVSFSVWFYGCNLGIVIGTTSERCIWMSSFD